jgi:selenium-binding protein 1
VGKVLQTVKSGAAPLECRWSLKEGANHGFTNCAFDNSIWVWEAAEGSDKYTTRKLCDTGKLPADLRMSADGKFLYVSCFVGNEVQQWDVSDLKKPRLTSTIAPGVQPNMMHLTGDGKRMYLTNSLLSTLDRSNNFWVRLAHVGPDGMKMDPFFQIDLTKLKDGKGKTRKVRGHDMLLN